jgi:uncharacterized protein with HEPN domain
VTRREGAWLADIAEAITAVERYLEGGTLAEGVVYDACRARLIEIGEAVKHLDPVLLQSVPDIRWRAIARMRDQLAHHYFDTDHAIFHAGRERRAPTPARCDRRPSATGQRAAPEPTELTDHPRTAAPA